MLRVGLTGGIGAGKSTVVSRFAQRGAWIIDSDRLAREVVEPGSEGLRAVVGAFDEKILTVDGALDRPALAARVFDDADARRRLNAILHPLVATRSAQLLMTAPPDAVVVQDIPLLVETGLEAGFPLVVVVYTDLEVRFRRLVERGMPEADVHARIAAQATDAQRRAAADVWLDNTGPRQDTLAAVDRLWTERLVPFEDNLRHHRRAPRHVAPLLVAPEDSWSQQAQRMITRIAAVAGSRAHRIDHIGSTAVPGLDAKDVLDVQVVVTDLDAARCLAGELIEVGLVRPDADPWWDHARDGSIREKAMVTNADPGRAVNCHIRPAGSPTWREALLLRDWLRAHPAGAREYAELKHGLVAQQPSNIEVYAELKTPFMHSALDRAQQWARQTGWQVT